MLGVEQGVDASGYLRYAVGGSDDLVAGGVPSAHDSDTDSGGLKVLAGVEEGLNG